MGKYNRNPKLYIILSLVLAAFAVICMATYMIMVSITDMSTVATGVILIAVYLVFGLAAYGVVRVINRFVTKRKRALDDDVTDLECSLTLNLLDKLYMPVVLINAQGKIIWYNPAFAEKAEKRTSVYGKSFGEFCPVDIRTLRKNTSPEGCTVKAFDAIYNIKAYELPYGNETLLLTTWNDRTKFEKAKKKIADENPLVAFIVIDNLEDIMQYAQESYRSASAKIEELLRSWSDSVDGIFREYERDRFMMIFQSKYLASFIASKFEILDKVRNIRVGESNLPVTISIGIADMDSALAEKERSSRAALDTALQRGGDQVVIKKPDGMEFYGGKVQSANRRSKVRARVVTEELSHRMAESDNVLIMAHVFPDFDAIGASVGIARLAEYCGTKFNIITNLTSPDFKKCSSKLSGYIDSGVFISGAQAKELITPNTLLIIVDVNNPKQLEAPDVADMVQNIAVIDHHRKAASFGYEPKVTYIEPAASSTCEMVAEMLEHALAPEFLTRDIADIMLAGIILDTKQFSKNTGARTFGAALYLRNEGANPSSAGALFHTDLSSLVTEANYESNVIIYRSSIAIAQNSNSDVDESVGRVAAAKAADKLLNVVGVEASFVVFHTDSAVHISARSNGKINVQLIAEKIGGGGHFDSAATRLTDVSLTQALTVLKKAIDEYLSENKENTK